MEVMRSKVENIRETNKRPPKFISNWRIKSNYETKAAAMERGL